MVTVGLAWTIVNKLSQAGWLTQAPGAGRRGDTVAVLELGRNLDLGALAFELDYHRSVAEPLQLSDCSVARTLRSWSIVMVCTMSAMMSNSTPSWIARPTSCRAGSYALRRRPRTAPMAASPSVKTEPIASMATPTPRTHERHVASLPRTVAPTAPFPREGGLTSH